MKYYKVKALWRDTSYYIYKIDEISEEVSYFDRNEKRWKKTILQSKSFRNEQEITPKEVCAACHRGEMQLIG